MYHNCSLLPHCNIPLKMCNSLNHNCSISIASHGNTAFEVLRPGMNIFNLNLKFSILFKLFHEGVDNTTDQVTKSRSNILFHQTFGDNAKFFSYGAIQEISLQLNSNVYDLVRKYVDDTSYELNKIRIGIINTIIIVFEVIFIA